MTTGTTCLVTGRSQGFLYFDENVLSVVLNFERHTKAMGAPAFIFGLTTREDCRVWIVRLNRRQGLRDQAGFGRLKRFSFPSVRFFL